MNKYKKEMRIKQLKAMHEVMINSNDERIYMDWVCCGVPDCPSEDDFDFIAGDDEYYNEACNLFAALIHNLNYRF